MNRKHAIVIALTFVLVGMMFFSFDSPQIAGQKTAVQEISSPERIQQLADGPVPIEPLKMNVLWNPSFETFSSGIPSNYIGTSSPHKYANDTYTDHKATGNYAGYLEAQGTLQDASVELKHDIPSSPSAVMVPDISLSFNYTTLFNSVFSNGMAFIEVVTTNSTNHFKYLIYVLSYHSSSLSNSSNLCYVLLNETQNEWNDFERNLSDDFRDAAFLGPLDGSRYVVQLAFYALSRATATEKIQFVIDDVVLTNGTYSDWVENGDFEAGIRQTGWRQYWNNAGAFVSQSTESTLGTYSLNLSIPEVRDGAGYGYVQQSFSYPAGYFIESPGSSVVAFDWKYSDAVGAGQSQYCHLRIQVRNESGAYTLYFYLGHGNDIISSGVNTTAQYHFELPGFGVRDVWQKANIDLWDYTQLAGFSNVSIEVMQFYFYNAAPYGYLEVLIDDFQLVTYPTGDPGFELDWYESAATPFVAWNGEIGGTGEVTRTSDSLSGMYACNITADDAQTDGVYRASYVDLDSDLLTDFWWRLDEVSNIGASGAWIQLEFYGTSGFYYIRYILGISSIWNPTNISTHKYVLADSFNQTGTWNLLTRNITADFENVFSTSHVGWSISGIKAFVSSGPGVRTSLIVDDFHFTDGQPPTIDSVTVESTPVYYASTNIRTIASDSRPGVSEVMINYTTNGGTSWNAIISAYDAGGWYNVYIPAQPYNTEVQFYVIVTDGVGLQTVDDNGGLYYAYMVGDDVDPTLTIDSPTDMAEVEGLIQINVTADDVGSGVDYVDFIIVGVDSQSDSIAPYSYDWQTDIVDLGMYTIEVIVRDIAGNTYSYSINVSVVDTMSPVVNEPPDDEFDEGTTGHFIVWDPGDPRPNSYEVLVDDIVAFSGLWNSSAEKINVSLDGLSAGVYNYTCVIYDDAGNSFADTVIVTVDALPTTSTTPTEPTTTPEPTGGGDILGLVLIVAVIGIVGILLVIFVFLPKMKK